MNPPQWQQLGIPESAAANHLEYVGLTFPDELPYEKYPGQHMARRIGIMNRGKVAILGITGFRHESPWLKRWPEFAREICPLTIEYLFGSWRDGFLYFDERLSASEARAQWEWIDEYHTALMWALILGDEASLKRITAWVGPDLPNHGGGFDLHPEDLAFHIILGQHLHGSVPLSANPLRDRITTGRRTRPKYALAAADAIFAGASADSRIAFHRYLKRYYEKDFEVPNISLSVCTDGTILWHLARRHGIDVTPTEPELRALIITGDVK
jgi:hypothetical protein